MSANSRKVHTVKQAAKFSGASVRTPRFYDEIGLLKPAFVGDNGYRYYEKEQLLALQQILFYRELWFELAMIQKIVSSPKFDKGAAMRSHREQLVKEAERNSVLIRTIDKTVAHLEQEVPMKDDEMYMGFDPKKQAEYGQRSLKRWEEAATARYKNAVEESKQRTKDWKREDFEKAQRDYDEIHRAFAEAIKNGISPSSSEVRILRQSLLEATGGNMIHTFETFCKMGSYQESFKAKRNL